LVALVLVSCGSPSAAPTQVSQAASAAAVPVSGPRASETAIANAISGLFTATAIAAATATQFAAHNPSPVPATSTPDPEQDPAYAARTWLAAFLSSDGAALGRYTCRARAEEVSDTAAINGVLMGGVSVLLGLTAPGQTFSIDISHVTFTVTEQNAARALVHSQGEAQIAVGGQFQTGSADGDFLMIYEDERWKWCGFVGE
jgi:hypothetical protein